MDDLQIERRLSRRRNAPKITIKKAKAKFAQKYPQATLNKFDFDAVLGYNDDVTRVDIFFINSDRLQTDINSDTFRNDKSMTQWLYNKSFPTIWLNHGTVQPLPLTESSMDRDSGKIVTFPPYVLNYQVSNFDVYVNDGDSFKSDLPKIVIDTKKFFRDGIGGSEINTIWALSKSYYQSLVGLYIATYRSGVSLQNLTPTDNIPKQITSLIRFHVYFTMRRVMYRLSKGVVEIANIKRLYIPDWGLLKAHLPLSGDWNTLIKDIQGDFKRYCPRSSNGVTMLGQELINQSIEVYMYAILGSQAKSKQSIIGKNASSREVQQVFRDIIEDAVIQYSPSVWINLMNKAIGDTNVKLDMAITPNTWLIPRSMVLLKTPIPGYNNLLRTSSTSGMSFGYNHGLNYNKPKANKNPHSNGGEHLETLDRPTKKTTKVLRSIWKHLINPLKKRTKVLRGIW